MQAWKPLSMAISASELRFGAGETEASFSVTANPSRLETFELRIVRTDDSSDRLRLSLPVVRTALAAFENNFFVCFIKKIPFGTRETRGADGSVTVEQIYKGR